MCCKCCSVLQQKIWVFTLGTAFLAIGILTICFWPGLIRTMIYNELPLSKTSKTYDKWYITPIPIYMHMYLWNWTNPDQVKNLNVKPNFVQMGPYVFREAKIKEDLEWHPNKTVTYFGTRTWFFVPEKTNGTLDDLITCPNVATAAVANQMRNEGKAKKFLLNTLLNTNGGTLTWTKTAEEWLFKGFYDQFLDFALKLNRPDVPVESAYFALFLDRNGTKDYEGTYTVHTGQGDLSKMGELTHWNGSDHTGYYEGECGKVNGSTGDLWVPNRPRDQAISMFIPDTCRYINLFAGENKRKMGIDAIKYGTNEMTFDSGEVYPNMKCFCPKESDHCQKTGVIDLGPCTQGSPMYMSHAHFYLADPSYRANITGMAPDPEKHTFTILMEPTLGVPLEVNADVMISLRIRRDNSFKIFKNIHEEFYAPFFTISQRAEIDEALAAEVRLALGLPSYGVYGGIALTAIGAIMLVIGIFLTITRNWKGQNKHLKK
ncbi:protein croquemort-like [Episyrphus balteatus]|uniref:protein croquemort-like n=1 Tax=Episyrphus balteatus TaxID=286459 RepID=UPI002486BCD1|nr:protein croquemort-like [Episyrphus balteatus]